MLRTLHHRLCARARAPGKAARVGEECKARIPGRCGRCGRAAPGRSTACLLHEGVRDTFGIG